MHRSTPPVIAAVGSPLALYAASTPEDTFGGTGGSPVGGATSTGGPEPERAETAS